MPSRMISTWGISRRRIEPNQLVPQLPNRNFDRRHGALGFVLGRVVVGFSGLPGIGIKAFEYDSNF